MTALSTAAAPRTAVAPKLPSERWTPALRRRVNVELAQYVGDDDVASKFRSPRECVEYYARYAQRPLSELAEELDELDEAALFHGLADEQPNETSLNGAARERGLAIADAREGIANGSIPIVRTATVGSRQYPRVRTIT